MIEERRLCTWCTIVLAATSVCAANVAGAADGCASYLKSGDFQVGGYAAYTRKVLADDATVAASMVVLTSYWPEYAVSIANTNASDKKWVARYAIVKASIWGSVDNKPPAVETRELQIDSSFAKHVVRVWKQVIAHPIPETSNLFTHGGAYFVFSVDGDRANTWSPDCGIPQLAVKSGEALRSAVLAKSRGMRKQALRQAVDALISVEQELLASPQARTSVVN